MSDLFNLGEIENSTKEKKEPQDHPKIKSLDKYIEQTLKCNTNEKNETLNKIKKKLTTLSDPSILEADILNESYYEISNNQIIRVVFKESCAYKNEINRRQLKI